jgi:hypothetical protein
MAVPHIIDLTSSASRSVELENAGRLLRFTFLGDLPEAERAALTAMPFLGARRRGRFSNYLIRIERGEKFAVFDFASGRGARKHEETVAALESPGLALPAFALRPERAIDRLNPAVAHQDIDFDAFPGFSRRFFLGGDDESAVRGLFTAERLRALEGHEPCVLAGKGKRMIYFEPEHLLWPGAFDGFVSRAGALFDRFRP